MMFKYMCLVLFITWYQLADCHPASSDAKLIDSMIEKESEAFLTVEAEESSHKTVRDKRTIGFLRQLFPNLSQIVDRKIQQITRFLFRVIGRLVLRGGAGGGAGGGTAAGGGGGGGSDAGGTGGRRISITLPTFPPSTEDEDEEQTEVPAATPAAAAEAVESRVADAAAVGTTPSVAVASDAAAATDSAPAESAVDVIATTSAGVTTTASMVTTTPAATAAATAANNAVTTTASSITASSTKANAISQPPSDSDNAVGNGIVKRTAREASTEKSSSAKKRSPLTDTETDDVSSSDNALSRAGASDEARPEAAVTDDEDPRNKRFLFNLRGGGSGGSGNVLFDMIRRGADRAARAAGGFYRVVAGTDPNTLTLAQPLQYPSLVAGSGANQDKDEVADGTQLEGAESQEVRTDVNAKEDGYSVGVPGPLTRIFIIANRGVANLVQDLILRLAQTTERIVNFKARLITSLI